MTSGARIDMQQMELMVGNHFQDMAVARNHESYPFLRQKFLHSGRIAARIAAYMRHPHLHALHLELLHLGAATRHVAVIDIAAHRTYGRDLLQAFKDADVAQIPGMPYLVAAGEMLPVAFVPAGMGVA